VREANLVAQSHDIGGRQLVKLLEKRFAEVSRAEGSIEMEVRE
jgi:hypothetical protein